MLITVYMKVLDMTKAASIVILLVLLARLLLKKAPKVFSYALWAIVLFRLLCPVSIEAPTSILPEITPVSDSYTLADVPISPVSAGAAAYQAVGDAMNGGLGIQHIRTELPDENGGSEYVSSMWWEVWVLFGQYVWLIGMAAMAVHAVMSYIKIRRKLITASPLRKNIFLADEITSPFVMGLVRPKIYLPSSMDQQEQSYILLHEQHHIHRMDHIFKALAFLALCIHWFNPLAWVAFILASRDMEMSCDEAVVKKLGEDIRADYTASLLSLATGKRIIAGTPLAFGEGDTKGRIHNLAKWKKPKIWIILIAVLACAILAVMLLTNPKEENPNVGITFYYGTVTDRAMSVVNEGDREGRAYLSLHCDDGEELLFWEADGSTLPDDLLGKHVMVRSRIEKPTGLLVATKVAITENTWADTVDEAIENAILDFNWSERYAEKEYFSCADYVILTSNGEGIQSIDEGIMTGKETFYGIALHQVFSVENGALVKLGGSHIPTVLTFTIDEGRYLLTEYWEPRDGSYYADDIKAKFPAFVWPDTQKYIEEQQARNLAKAEAYFALTAAEVPKDQTVQELSGLDYYAELAMPGQTFRMMDAAQQGEILGEYGELLADFRCLARESEDGSMFFLAGYYQGEPQDNPFAALAYQTADVDGEMVQVLYRKQDAAKVEQALAMQKLPDTGWVIRNSFIHYSAEAGCFLIHPMYTGWDLGTVFRRYQSAEGRAYMQDAANRGIAQCISKKPYLEVYLISPRWGELAERIPLTQEQVTQILAEDREKLEPGYGFSAMLYLGDYSTVNMEEEATWFTEFSGIPKTVLDLAIEKCGYQFASPADITGTIVEATLECPWLDAPLHAQESDLQTLQTILTNAKFGSIARCGYGAKLTVKLSDGTQLTMFKGTDGCDTLAFGSYGGYFIGDKENIEFW